MNSVWIFLFLVMSCLIKLAINKTLKWHCHCKLIFAVIKSDTAVIKLHSYVVLIVVQLVVQQVLLLHETQKRPLQIDNAVVLFEWTTSHLVNNIVFFLLHFFSALNMQYVRTSEENILKFPQIINRM